MSKKNLLVFIVVVILVVILLGLYYFSDVFNKNQNRLSAGEIMEIIKTDKDYNELSGFIGDFEPEIVDYIKFGPNEYQAIKPKWQEKGLTDRIGLVDKINLTNSTYWIELKNKKDESKGLRIILNINERKSLLLIAALSVEAGLGLQ